MEVKHLICCTALHLIFKKTEIQKNFIGMHWLTQRVSSGIGPQEDEDIHRVGCGGWGLKGGRWVRVGERLLNGNSCFSELTSNFPFFSNGSTWASLDKAASLFGTPSPSISSTIITVSHFPKQLAGNMSDLMLSPKYTTCRIRKKEGDWEDGLFTFKSYTTV